jgi:hypothetical protein
LAAIRIVDSSSRNAVRALQVDPANARVTAPLGRRLADEALKQGGDPAKPDALEEKLIF